MANKSEYQSITLHHPHFRKGARKPVGEPLRNAKGEPLAWSQDYQGEPDLFPPVTVNNEQQEAFYRAKGYLASGESPPAPAEYAEFPVMLSHPDFVEAVPDRFDMVRMDSGEVKPVTIPGKPGQFPPVMASSAAEEKAWNAKGYKRIGKADGAAAQTAKASPYDPDFTAQEYPKVVDGKIVDPRNDMEHNRYPMYVGDKLVNSAEEEAEARGIEAPVLPAGNCIFCGEAFQAGQTWGNGAAGPYHLSHTQNVSAPPPAHPVDPPVVKSAKRIEAGKKAAETRAAKKKRMEQQAQS